MERTPIACSPPQETLAPPPKPEPPRPASSKKKKKGGANANTNNSGSLGKSLETPTVTDTDESRPATPNPPRDVPVPVPVPGDAMLFDRSVEGGLDGVLGMSRSQLVGFDGLVVEVDEASGAVTCVQVWR
jgi:hypothetical protein